jgi:hypothetical protein
MGRRVTCVAERVKPGKVENLGAYFEVFLIREC